MKLLELLPNLGALRTQLDKVFGEQQKVIDELKLKIGDLTTRLEGTEVPEDAAGVLGEINALVKRMDDLTPDTTPEGGNLELGAAPVAPRAATTGQPLQPAGGQTGRQAGETVETSEQLQEANTIPQLLELADKENVDLQGATLKADIADRIVATRKEKAAAK